MRVIVQRVKHASVEVDHCVVGSIQKGFLLYVGLTSTDTMDIVKKMAQKIHSLRIFEDEFGKMNLNLDQVSGSILAISQFTLYGDTKGNNRPSFTMAMQPKEAEILFESLVSLLRVHHVIAQGVFGAHMNISSINDGPVTIIIEM